MAAPLPPSAVMPAPSLEDTGTGPHSIVDNQETATGSGFMNGRLPLADEPVDTRSDADTSSLSELIDGSEDHDGPRLLSGAASIIDENDSEAETERLENTPRKPLYTGLAEGLRIGNMNTSPSRLATPIPTEARSPPESPITPLEETDVPTLDNKNMNDEALAVQQSLATISEAGSLLESLSRKRKRTTPEDGSTLFPDLEGPPRKRSESARPDLVDHQSPKTESARDMRLVTGDNTLEQQNKTVDGQDLGVEEEAVGTPEGVAETVAKVSKGRKGKRKGKKVAETTEKEGFDVGDAPEDAEHNIEDEEDIAAQGEETVKKQKALEDLAPIREKFMIFREKVLDEQLGNLNLELESLEAAEPTHADFLAMIRCIDERRDEKLAFEDKHYEYKVKTLKKTVIAERHQIQSQYFQQVREHRSDAIETCQKQLNRLQQERRRAGAEEVEYSLLYNPKRSEQIKQQAAINREVSILAGFAKYRGFPAAPDITRARPSEIEADFKDMDMQRPPPPPPVAPTYTGPVPSRIRADHQTLDDDFLQRNIWANPQHPSHLQSRNASRNVSRNTSPQPRPSPIVAGPSTLVTPAGQKRSVDINAPNGSVSTIDANSNPPSASNTADQLRSRKAGSSSPLMPFKRPAGGAEPSRPTPASTSNNASPVPQSWRKDNTLEPHPYSSPIMTKNTGSPRPFALASAAASALSAGHDHAMPGSSRNKTPIGQRGNGLSVGNFGR